MTIRQHINLIENYLSEIEIGGGVDSGHLDAYKETDYDNKQLDLFKEIPTLDPNLPPTMEVVGKIDTYRVVYSSKFGSKDYLLFDKNHPVAWIALKDKIDREHKIEIIDHGTGAQVGAVYVDPEYRGKNIAVKFYYWLLQNVCDYIVADRLQTRDGVKLWKKLQSLPQFEVQVFDKQEYDSRKRRRGTSFNMVYKTDDRLIPWMTLKGKASKLLYGDNDA